MLVAALLAWLDHEQRDVIAFLREENRVLKAQLGGRRLRLSDDQRRRLAMLGQRHLLRAIAEFIAHYHAERNHQGLDDELIQPLGRRTRTGAVRCRQRMGGMLNYCYRAA